MNDIRRTVLWIIFSMSLVMIWNAWNIHNGNPSMFSPGAHPPVAASGAAGSAASGVANTAVATSAAAALPLATAASGAAPAVGELVTVQTDVFKATLDTRGGDLVGLDLLKYRDTTDEKKRLRLFDHSAERVYLAQTGLAPTVAGTPLPNHLTVMHLVSPERVLADGQDALTLRFESPEIGGVQLIKTYTFRRGQYLVGVSHEVINRSGAPVSADLYLQLVRDGHVTSSGSAFAPGSFTGAAGFTDASKFRQFKFEDIDKNKTDPLPDAEDGWVAMVEHYFASAWLLDGKAPRHFKQVALDASQNGIPTYSNVIFSALGAVAPGASKKVDASLYAGPQEEKKLAAIAPGLELVKDYGRLHLLASPLFWLLERLHTLIGNWGWAIVALVVLLKIAFYWLNARAYRSMAKMKAINPKVQELRERYKDKPQQMQQEMMRIYREEKVNPLGGCLPIFVQMPVFIALYYVLFSTVELRDAAWIGWIADLSSKDPLYILPALMAGTSLFQVWLQPAPADPVQAKMMWIMPLAFSGMFFVFPSGLTLYYLTQNLLTIAQQWFINRQLGVN